MKTKPKALKIHSLCGMVPSMSTEGFATLKDDIARNGLREPIWIKDGKIIDGRHRYRACLELGIECPTREFEGTDIEAFVISMNVARRQLSAQQRRGFVKRLLQLQPEKSDRAIASLTGGDHKIVSRLRKKIISTGVMPQLSIRVGVDGRKRKTPQPTYPSASLVNGVDFQMKRFVKWLADLHPHELTDPRLFIQQVRDQLQRMEDMMDSNSIGRSNKS